MRKSEIGAYGWELFVRTPTDALYMHIPSMPLCVCVHTHVHACVCACAYVYACGCAHARVHVCVHAHVDVEVRVFVYMCAYMYACVHTFIHACGCVCACMCAHACMHIRGCGCRAHMHVCACARGRVRVRACVRPEATSSCSGLRSAMGRAERWPLPGAPGGFQGLRGSSHLAFSSFLSPPSCSPAVWEHVCEPACPCRAPYVKRRPSLPHCTSPPGSDSGSPRLRLLLLPVVRPGSCNRICSR